MFIMLIGKCIRSSTLAVMASVAAVAWILMGCGTRQTISSINPPNTTGPQVLYLYPSSANTVWALTPNGVTISTDDGTTWRNTNASALTGPGTASGGFQAISVLNSSSAWLAAFNISSGQKPSVSLFRTADAGTSWTRRNLTLDSSPIVGPYAGTGSLFFADNMNGWLMARLVSSAAFSNGVLYRTTDGGASWIEESIPIAGTIGFVTLSDGWVAGGAAGAELYATHDGGATWIKQSVPQQSAAKPWLTTVATPHFFDPLHGVLPVQVRSEASGGSSLYFFVTNDGGVSWSAAGPSVQISQGGDLFSGDARSTSFVDAKNWFVLVVGKLYATHDGGQTWAAVVTSQDLSGVVRAAFSTTSDGWAYAAAVTCPDKINCETTTHLFKTQDGGQTWIEVSIQ